MLVVASAVVGWLIVGLFPAVAICEGRILLHEIQDMPRTVVHQQPEPVVDDPNVLASREDISVSVVISNWDHYPVKRTVEMQGNVGIYEEQTLVTSSAFLFVRDEVSVSVVTRYWGEPPANLGLQANGGELFRPILMLPNTIRRVSESGSCEWVSALGAWGYGTVHMNQETSSPRGAHLAVGGGGEASDSEFGFLTEVEEAALEARFGPPTLVSTPLASVRAFLWV